MICLFNLLVACRAVQNAWHKSCDLIFKPERENRLPAGPSREVVAMPLKSTLRSAALSTSTEGPARRTVPSCRGGASSMLRLAQPSSPSWFAGAGLLPTGPGLSQRGTGTANASQVLQPHRRGSQLSLFPRSGVLGAK
jgi:hypothetical protein